MLRERARRQRSRARRPARPHPLGLVAQERVELVRDGAHVGRRLRGGYGPARPRSATDFVLGQVIDFLKGAQQSHDTAMLYVSDHGESLGEGGLYLHGMPWAIAPDAQTHVPFVVWLSPGFRHDQRLNEQCLRSRARQQSVSHDYLFHTLLGVFGVQTRVYEPALDLFAPCRGKS